MPDILNYYPTYISIQEVKNDKNSKNSLIFSNYHFYYNYTRLFNLFIELNYLLKRSHDALVEFLPQINIKHLILRIRQKIKIYTLNISNDFLKSLFPAPNFSS